MNVLLKQTLDVLIHLVRCGYYSSVKDVDEIMILLIKVLDESDQPKGKAKIILYVTFCTLTLKNLLIARNTFHLL